MVDFAFEGLLVGHVGHFVGAAAADGGDDTFEGIRRVIVDDPLSFGITMHRGDAGIEPGALFKGVSLP